VGNTRIINSEFAVLYSFVTVFLPSSTVLLRILYSDAPDYSDGFNRKDKHEQKVPALCAPAYALYVSSQQKK
jgi:hypothetical protein